MNLSEVFENEVMETGDICSIGINDGKIFRNVKYLGTSSIYGKPVMAFETTANEIVTINPSYHTFTITQMEEKQNEGD